MSSTHLNFYYLDFFFTLIGLHELVIELKMILFIFTSIHVNVEKKLYRLYSYNFLTFNLFIDKNKL